MLLNLDDPVGWEIGMMRLREEADRRERQEVEAPPRALLGSPPLLDFDLGRVRRLLVPEWFFEELRTLTSEMAPFIDARLVGVEVKVSQTIQPNFALATLLDGSHQFLSLPPRGPEKAETPRQGLARRAWKAITGAL